MFFRKPSQSNMSFFPQTSDWFAYVLPMLWVSQRLKSLRTWVIHVLALLDSYTLSNVFTKATLKGRQALSTPISPTFFTLHCAIRDTHWQSCSLGAWYHSALSGWSAFLSNGVKGTTMDEVVSRCSMHPAPFSHLIVLQLLNKHTGWIQRYLWALATTTHI